MADAEKIALYKANVERLEKQVAGLEVMRARLGPMSLGILALALPAFFVSKLAVLAVMVGAVSVFGVGHYIALMHVTEDREAIRIARRALEELQGGDDPRQT
jgi:hypothetical protein